VRLLCRDGDFDVTHCVAGLSEIEARAPRPTVFDFYHSQSMPCDNFLHHHDGPLFLFDLPVP